MQSTFSGTKSVYQCWILEQTRTHTHNDYLNKTNSSPQDSAFLAAPWYTFEGES